MNIKVAVVHDWLVTYAGAERVLEQILTIYPQADLFALCDFLPDHERAFIGGRKVSTTFIQRLPSRDDGIAVICRSCLWPSSNWTSPDMTW